MNSIRQEREERLMQVCSELLLFALKDNSLKLEDDNKEPLQPVFKLFIGTEDGKRLTQSFEFSNQTCTLEKTEDGTYKVSFSLEASVVKQ